MTSQSSVSPVRAPAPAKYRNSLFHATAVTALTALVCVVYGSIDQGMSSRSAMNDHVAHLLWGQDLFRTGKIVTPHFFYQAVIALLCRTGIMPSLPFSGVLVAVLAYGATAMLLYLFLLHAANRNSIWRRPAVVFLASLSLMVAQPLVVAPWAEIGYFWTEPYNSPTFALFKPFSLIVFACAAWYLSERRTVDYWLIAVFAAMTVASTLTKPSFIVCLLPVGTLLLLWRMLQKKPVSFVPLLLGLILPAAVALGWQYYISYTGRTGLWYQDSIIWAPLQVMHYHTAELPKKLLLSIVFPLLVSILYWNRLRSSVMMQAAWGSFVLALFYTYTLAEKIRLPAGNFLWSAYISLFILFFASSIFLVRQLSAKETNTPRWKGVLCCTALIAHAVAGALMDWTYLNRFGFV